MKNKKQKGIVLAITLMILFILVVIAVSIGAIGIFNLRGVNNYKYSQIAYYSARTGIIQAIDAMRIDRSWTGEFDKVQMPGVNAVYTVSFTSSKYYSTNNLNGQSAVTRADGIYVPARHAYIISTGVCNGVTRRVAAMARNNTIYFDPPWEYALFGYNSVSVQSAPSSVIGSIGTNTGNIYVHQQAEVTGDRNANAGQSQQSVIDPVTGPSLGDIRTTATLAPGKYGSLILSSSELVTLSAGSYSFSRIDLGANGGIVISSGPVYVYVNGDMKITGQSVINNTGNSTNCVFYGTPAVTTVNLRGGANAYYGVYAPQADVTFLGNAIFHGAAIGNNAIDGGTAAMVYDPNFQNMPPVNIIGPYLRIISWQNVY